MSNDDELRSNFFYRKRNKQEIAQYLNNFFGLGWQQYDAKHLLEKAGEILGIKTDITNGLIGNDDAPKYLANMSPFVCISVCNDQIQFGEQQIVFFVLDKMVSRDILEEIRNEPYLFDFNSENAVISGDEEDPELDANEKMSDYSELYDNVKTVWGMLQRK